MFDQNKDLVEVKDEDEHITDEEIIELLEDENLHIFYGVSMQVVKYKIRTDKDDEISEDEMQEKVYRLHDRLELAPYEALVEEHGVETTFVQLSRKNALKNVSLFKFLESPTYSVSFSGDMDFLNDVHKVIDIFEEMSLEKELDELAEENKQILH